MMNCLNCQEKLFGRKDKKFCNTHCRSDFHNQTKRLNQTSKKINKVLFKNHQIISSLLVESPKLKVCKKELYQRQFNFNFFTHQYMTKEGNIYRFCYDHGYLELDNEMCLLVKEITKKTT
jgi:hypothetical protein